MNFKIALRNILRNRRRTLMTLLAIAVSAVAIVLFGEFIGFIEVALETNTVRKVGHLTVLRTGYLDYGAGNPGAYGISDYDEVIRLIQEDPDIRAKLNVVTPTVSLTGIAGNFEIDASKTFYGIGFVPSDRDRMQRWDDSRLIRRVAAAPKELALRDDDETRGVVGVGLARMLGLCEKLKIQNCPPRPRTDAKAEAIAEPPLDDIVTLARTEVDSLQSAHVDNWPRLDLLAATASGAPNVMSLFVTYAEQQGVKELDDNYIAMHFKLAQSLLFGRGKRKASAIVLQLKHTGDLPTVRSRLGVLFKEHNLDLEIRDFAEREPVYKQTVGMFRLIFMFIALIMGVIVLFTVVNTMGMSVMERTNEIGTTRAMGDRRATIRRLFIIEGAMLGALGGIVGVVTGQVIALLFNQSGVTWTPPGNATRVPLHLLTSGGGGFLMGAWFALVIVATIAALIPANRAARLRVVDALRHI